MERVITVLCIVASATSGVLSVPLAQASYNSVQERIRQLADEFNALQGDPALLDLRPASEGNTPSRLSYWTDIVLQDSFRPRHCADLLRNGQNTSGVYTVFHKAAGTSGQNVYCDMDTDGGGWTVIQRRGQYGNPVYYFYRNWTEYTNGFGNPAQEYWIGNSALHALTSGDEKMALRIVLSNSTGETVSLDYKNFTVGSKEEHFKLKLGDYTGKTGWDAIWPASGQKFSTFDQDNDGSSTNCAFRFRGGWWYANCLSGNLNGLNLNGPHNSAGDGIDWNTKETLYQYSYPNVRMMIRPRGSR